MRETDNIFLHAIIIFIQEYTYLGLLLSKKGEHDQKNLPRTYKV